MRDHYKITLEFDTEPGETSEYDVLDQIHDLVREAYSASHVDAHVLGTLEYDRDDES